MERKKQAPSLALVDWTGLARKAIDSPFIAGIVGGALEGIAKFIDAESWLERAVAEARERQAAANHHAETDDDEAQVSGAADLLGVTVDASESEIRAALRARLASSRLHPDQGGDGEEAKRLIAAQNLLIARRREERGP
jgi:hypothetical protein